MDARVQRPGSRQYRALVADDDDSARDSLVSLLAGDGFVALSAAGGLQAIELIEMRPRSALIDFLVLDYNMPDLTGIDVLRTLKLEMRVCLPSILVTGEASPDLEREVIALGGIGLVPKPVEPGLFRGLVRQLVERHLRAD